MSPCLVYLIVPMACLVITQTSTKRSVLSHVLMVGLQITLPGLVWKFAPQILLTTQTSTLEHVCLIVESNSIFLLMIVIELVSLNALPILQLIFTQEGALITVYWCLRLTFLSTEPLDNVFSSAQMATLQITAPGIA